MAYFDNAATTYPKPEIVYQSMDQFQRHTGGSFGRGNYGFSSSAKSIVDDTRAALQQLLHCPAKQVIFEPSATISLNIIIQGIIEKGARNIYRKLQVQVGHPAVENWFHLSPSFG